MLSSSLLTRELSSPALVLVSFRKVRLTDSIFRSPSDGPANINLVTYQPPSIRASLAAHHDSAAGAAVVVDDAAEGAGPNSVPKLVLLPYFDLANTPAYFDLVVDTDPSHPCPFLNNSPVLYSASLDTP